MENGTFYEGFEFSKCPLVYASHISNNGDLFDRLSGFYNARYKYVFGSDGSAHCVEECYSSRPVFNGDKLIPLDSGRKIIRSSEKSDSYIADSKRRALRKLRDYILANDFDYFVTLTLDGAFIDRTSYSDIIVKFNNYFDNNVRRRNWKYVAVAEYHKRDKAIHFHALVSAETIPLIHSCTYIPPAGGRPLRGVTLEKRGIPLSECRDVYNITSWKYGFSTAIKTYGDRLKIYNYVGKYITKSGEKIGGRWYYSGGDLKLPFYVFDRVDYDSVDVEPFDTDGGEFKIIYHDEVIT